MHNAQLAFERASQNAQLAEQGWSQRFNAELAAHEQQRANLAAQAQIGAALRDVDQQQRQAPITSAQQVVAMLNGLPIGLFTGEEVKGTEAFQSTQKTKSSNFDIGLTKFSEIGDFFK